MTRSASPRAFEQRRCVRDDVWQVIQDAAQLRMAREDRRQEVPDGAADVNERVTPEKS